ncbi:AER063Wp [Eremothecium gossypii ATCC 10895]|uniref:Cytochrome c oxidase subunit 9, mitochondrial n=1 Tax=Eremothecium gossypii (strain ATCC 10895 / CBS 109.51 / FGSC 9923 / NRRL Y-1056) TaxID=284811 RepID=COX9_EREGS|nr:AER063Wp [Eremothecium gossypii ATCC 10895]Q757F0.3 RecName: Full=Cytochrome c oxidase subunit 9, mitochondrial; AltName: Full=Cytochrome c oxidase polypeptide VIIA; Flags: Precursor [Eremothecium gossypii ATCC 10895]AAS52747.1 AER063Wp [Eremothecium gossypii ATCC 10895]AEY97053.1 FAER063Wp [Eremothecium gossypii FDAG1]
MSAIAPITGSLKKRIMKDIAVGMGLGTVLGSYWWWGFHKPKIAARENYYTQLAEQKAAEE